MFRKNGTRYKDGVKALNVVPALFDYFLGGYIPTCALYTCVLSIFFSQTMLVKSLSDKHGVAQ